MTGCASTIPHIKHPQWSTSIAADHNSGQVEYLDLNGLLMEWSTSLKGEGWLYLTHPYTRDRVWTFPARVPTGEDRNGVKVSDGDCITAVHESGRQFRIEVVIQTEYFAKVKYRESNKTNAPDKE